MTNTALRVVAPADVKPGDIGLARVPGFVGALIGLGQLLNGDASRFDHAFIVVDLDNVVEARPGGAGYRPLAHYLGRSDVIFLTAVDPLTDAERALIVKTAVALRGTPYSFLDYGSLALHRLHIRPQWVEDYVESTGHMICSQLVDCCWAVGGRHLFDDGRFPGDVTPGDIDALRDTPSCA